MISIITPHHNDFLGLERLYTALKTQTNMNFEWIIVDDLSNIKTQTKLKHFKLQNLSCSFIKILFSEKKLFASGARNKGVEVSLFNKIVFVDSDDLITSDFVNNRTHFLNFDLVVFLKIKIIKDYKNLKGTFFSDIETNFLANFLSTKFCWQTSAMVFEKSYFNKIGGFSTELILLEDVLLSINSLAKSDNIKIVKNNDIDFYYFTKPIDISNRSYLKVSKSVRQFILQVSEIKSKEIQKNYQLLISYYYLVCRYFVKDKISFYNVKDLILLLYLFYKYQLINSFKFILGFLSIVTLIKKSVFLKINRKLFKKLVENNQNTYPII